MSTQPPDALQRPRRFYRDVDAALVEGGWAVRLDGRTARTPAKAKLVAPTQALAARLAEEWAGQGEWIVFSDMPAVRLAFTAIDRAPLAREGLADQIARTAGADLLCYFADAPRELAERQSRQWSPWLDWAGRELGVRLIPAAGVMHQAQPPESLARAGALAAELDDFALTGLAFAVGLFGSAVLALALQRGQLTGAAAHDLARLDEAFQEEQWGVDHEAAVRAASMRRDALMLDDWFSALATAG